MEARLFLRFVDRVSYHNDSFFINLRHKFFVSIHLLHSSICFKQYRAHLQKDNFINTSGNVTPFR